MLNAERRLIHGHCRLSERDVATSPIRYRKKGETSTGQTVEVFSKDSGLTDEDLRELLSSGVQSTFVNRVGWASTHMK
jgi:restriction endonuclease Mrr